ncbi:MAG: hypothetical protein DME25_02310 [Verrucomicrobia bacterium]|nr:MAG: hypothetical protein DME25_02310 [Verrucomicrobiota bacterium]
MAACAVSGEETPKGWFHAGNRPKDYEMSVDRRIVHGGKSSAHLKSIVTQTTGFGTLMQTFKADAYRGKRVRMSGYVRAQDVADWAGLWMRVDGPKGEPLAFDNMQQRPINGTSEWQKHQIVLDVLEAAEEIAFGILLTGQGEVWLDDLNFETVGKDVPTTGESQPDRGVRRSPTNLDFEE